MAKKPTKPRTKAKTAWELLERVIQHIKEEPQRYYQDWWCYRDTRKLASLNLSPPCGTAACRAGWIVALHDGPTAAPLRHAGRWPSPVESRANEILGLDSWDTSALFAGGMIDGTPGTRAYVREGVRGLREFMKEYKAHLKARQLRGV